MTEWLEWLGHGAETCHKVVSSRLGFAMQQLENSLCQQSSTFLESGKGKAEKGEEWAQPSISCAQDTVEL